MALGLGCCKHGLCFSIISALAATTLMHQARHEVAAHRQGGATGHTRLPLLRAQLHTCDGFPTWNSL